jgi:hypothetical protein
MFEIQRAGDLFCRTAPIARFLSALPALHGGILKLVWPWCPEKGMVTMPPTALNSEVP